MARRRRALLAIAVAALVVVAAAVTLRGALLDRLPARAYGALAAWRYGLDVDHAVRIPMRDGVVLAASLYRPRSATRMPTILVRMPYHRMRFREAFRAGTWFARQGYAVLVEDLRGTGDSGGELLPWRDAEEDGASTLDWIAAQAWSDGQVGTFGCSALGETQFALARRGHPAHRAMVPSGAGGAVGSAAGRYSYFGVFEGGVFELASGFGWFVASGSMRPDAAPARRFDAAGHLARLPVSALVQEVRPAPNGYDAFLATPLGDARWSQWGFLDASDRPRVPALVVNTWGDQTVGDTLALAESWRRSDPVQAARQKVVIAPGLHCAQDSWKRGGFGDLQPRGEDFDSDLLALAWFDAWMRGKPQAVESWPPYRYYMLGEDRWLAASSWPPEDSRLERWHLASGGHANSRNGDGILARERPTRESADRWRYDPAHPVPSRGGPLCCTGNATDRAGPVDQGEVEVRDDVLVYTSAPLAQPLRIAGPLRARFTLSSSAPDTDLVARLVDVFPDGRALNIQEGALRLRYREGFERPTRLEPGQRYAVEVDLRSIAWTLPAGHRLRLDVASSSFPRLERNLNTGAANNADETRMQVAENTLHHGGGDASWIELPVLP